MKCFYKGFIITENERDRTCTVTHKKYVTKIFLNMEVAKMGINCLDLDLVEPAYLYPERNKPKKEKASIFEAILAILMITAIVVVVGLIIYSIYTFGFWVCFWSLIFFIFISSFTVSFGIWF